MLYDVRCVLCTRYDVLFDIDSHMYVLGMRVLSLFSMHMVDQLRAPIPTTRGYQYSEGNGIGITFVSEERNLLSTFVRYFMNRIHIYLMSVL